MRSILRALMVVVTFVGFSSAAQNVSTLRVYSSNGVRAMLEELEPRLEEVAGRRLEFQFSTARTLKDRLEGGEAFDVAILTPDLIDELIATGSIAAGSRTEFARVGIGVGVRPGLRTARLTGMDDLRRVLLQATSVAYGASGQSRRTNEAAFDKLGIADAVHAKVRLTGPGEAPALVAAGEVDVVLTLVSELEREPGLRFLGPLPAEVQAYIDFAAGRAVAARDPEAAEAVLELLASPEVAGALARHGLEPAGR